MNDVLRLLWTQTWQIAVLAFVVAIVTRTVARNRPHLAHAMWLLVLIKCVTPPIWGHSLGLFSRLQAAISTEQTPSASDATYENIPQAAEPSPSLVRPSLEPAFHIAGNSASDLTTTRELPTTESSPATVPAVDLSEVTATKSVEGVRGHSYSWPAILLFCVAAGAFVTLSLMIVRCVQCLRSIHRHRTTEFDAMLIERVQDLSRKLRLRRAPRVIVSDVLFGPAVLGFLKHSIVLPRCLLQSSRSFLPERTFAEGEPARRTLNNTGLSEGTECTQVAASREVLPGRQDLQSLDPILAHELLHIRRGDLRTGTLQAVVQSLWWFHPAVWFCNRWLSREAERCCDEQVIAELGCSPAQYARSLLSVIESKHALQPIPVFPGMKPVEITSQRMERIMSLKSNLKKQTPLWCWLAVAGLAIVVLPGAVADPMQDETRGQAVASTIDPAVVVAGLQQARSETKGSNDGAAVGDSASAIRFEEDFGWSPAIQPRTIVAYVNNKPITVLDIVPAAHELFQFSITRRNDSDPKQLPLESAILKRAPEYLYQELLLQHFQAFATEEQKVSLQKHCEEQFLHWKDDVKRKEKCKTDDELNAWLLSSRGGVNLDGLQKSFSRMHTVQGYIEMLPKNSPLLEKQKILQHCRMLFDVAALHMTVVKYPIPELVKTDDSGQVVGHGHTSRRSIYLKELESMLTSLERDSWQTYGGLGTVTIDDKNETVSICQTKSVHVKVAALLAELEAEVIKRKKRLVLRSYSVADLITRSTLSAASSSELIDGGTVRSAPDSIPSEAADTDPNTREPKLAFAPLVELIKASIEPESWDTGGGAVAENRESISLVIRQTAAGHEAIAKLLSQLRKSYDSIQVTCRLIKLTADSQLKGLEEKCSLHPLSNNQRWALLTKSRTEALQKFLADEKVEVLSCPTIVTISGQAALVQVASTDGAALTGFQLSANPHLIADSSVIRLSHSVTVGELAKDAQAAVHESLVGSGQTLLLVIEQPGKVDGRPDRFAVMLTPEHVKEEEETKSGLKE